MQFTSADVVVFIGAYLLGSLSFAVIVSKLMGLDDPRSYGSGNPGATNVLRSGNRKAAALTLAGDALKGWLAVFLARQAAAAFALDATAIAGAALAVTLGHMWPVFFRFKGGKGVATAAGILLALDWRLGLALLAIWLILAKGFKISSLAALLAALAAPVLTWYLLPQSVYLYAVCVIAVLLIARHHQNIRGLLAGKEGKIGDKA
ncbi:glycerol-3-phosphate acyltransferase PlsY [Andreprevotia lacus DSM 23236]|jgi:glycerol-3-phosphate acyltransferase PlsY|uniref:Glycerol-3-phosphate acyltransferase n=1 Tax=Andreprevotia lacus DSM 23236 TaxID=1121001 RepID=A0A1W1XCW9_9NEIS|nr:glycerol-3-phosphate 1-O-acyltransferase PlsY [Andreprevotia lacus]SMC21885.1 glycerol-3-phosphate acyltransferase PlsY [Andreprevotia lacus DSM 23236]